MRILRLLNKKFIIIFFLFFTADVSNEPVDIWNIDKKDNQNKNDDNKFLFVDSDRNFSAQFIKRDNDNYVSTPEYVHSEEETNSNEDVQSIIAHKKKCDELASSSEVF